MRNKFSISVLSFFPAIFLFVVVILLAKLYFVDMQHHIENEKTRIEKDLLLKASEYQSNFTYLLKKNDFSEINKLISIFLLDNHYTFFSIYDHNFNIIAPKKNSYSKKDFEEVEKEIEFHSIKSFLNKEKIFIHYDKHIKSNQHFDVAIPLNATVNTHNLKSKSSFIIYFHYDISLELENIKSNFFEEAKTTFIVLSLTLLISMYIVYSMVFKRITDLSDLSKEYAAHNFSNRAKIAGFREIQDFSQTVNYMADQMQKYIHTIESQKNELKKTANEVLKFHRIVKQSPLLVMITDINGEIQYVNPSFCNITGYREHEIIGQNTNILRSGKHTNDFYATMWNVLREKEVWKGKLINHTKDHKDIIVDTEIFPLYDENDTVTNYISIQKDVTKETEQQKALAFQSKQAQMGEMLSMIAHQWRQPLASINAIVIALNVKYQLGKLQLDDIPESFTKITDTVEYLSKTISDFSDFYKPDNLLQITSFTRITQKAVDIIEAVLKSNGVSISVNVESLEFKSHENELVQVILNLLKNSLDIFIQNKSLVKKEINIFTKSNDKEITLVYQDSAGGCNIEPIENIFEPYFTTKKELQGTGLGLYMSKTIIEDHCNGELAVANIENGLEFQIIIPIK